MGVIVGRHIEGITINPLEYLLDDEGELVVFESEEQARQHLIKNGYSKDDLYWIVFEEVEDNEIYKNTSDKTNGKRFCRMSGNGS